MRKQVNLNFDWKFTPEFQESFLNQIIETWDDVMIPHTMKELPLNYFDEKSYQLKGTYSKSIEITEEMKAGCILLEFQAVMNTAYVYLNGQLIMEHIGGYTPFEIDITEISRIGMNILQVVVDSSEICDVPPFGHLVDYLAFSGIYREVSLNLLPKTHINKCYLSTTESDQLSEDSVTLTIDMSIKQKGKENFQVKVEIIQDGKAIHRHTFDELIETDQQFVAKINEIKRWSIEEPYLYDIKIYLLRADKIYDLLTIRFGFRTAHFTPEGFLLNNKPIKLIGLNRHQSYPYVGYAMPKSMQELDAEILKDYGCNIVRTSHYMQSNHFIRKCDELGLLVLEEIPGWQYIGNEQFKELTYKNIEAMIHNHFNHPSIITWGVRINESADDHDFYLKTNELARNLDPTRQTCGVRNTKKGEFLEDIYSYNDFSHNGDNLGLENPAKVTPGYVPYIVTEHNGHMFPTKKQDPEPKRIEQAMRHANVIDAAYGYDKVSGAIGWCLSDYNTHFQFGSNDRICHHGVMDSFRIPKHAAYVYKSQREDEPVLYVANNMISGDYDEFRLPEVVVFSNCEYIKIYKNNQLIGDYYPDTDSYPNIPYPPYIIDDLIGDLIIENEKFKEKDARKITNLLLQYQKYGFKLPLISKLSVAGLFIRKIINFGILMDLHEKYVSNQGDKPTVFRFEGYNDDELVISKEMAHSKKFILVAKSNTEELHHGYTYDVARIVIELKDEYDNTMNYSNDVISIQTSEHLKVIGPENVALLGGSVGVYVKTTGKAGKAWISISSKYYGEIKLTYIVK